MASSRRRCSPSRCRVSSRKLPAPSAAVSASPLSTIRETPPPRRKAAAGGGGAGAVHPTALAGRWEGHSASDEAEDRPCTSTHCTGRCLTRCTKSQAPHSPARHSKAKHGAALRTVRLTSHAASLGGGESSGATASGAHTNSMCSVRLLCPPGSVHGSRWGKDQLVGLGRRNHAGCCGAKLSRGRAKLYRCVLHSLSDQEESCGVRTVALCDGTAGASTLQVLVHGASTGGLVPCSKQRCCGSRGATGVAECTPYCIAAPRCGTSASYGWHALALFSEQTLGRHTSVVIPHGRSK
mmetsp:Transcript_5679/g.18014  ORF Transcript_5679/g.18014 Transcript_5679/m.18014 type:complete len:295 (-) Transcript_5679:132-1016(-)